MTDGGAATQETVNVLIRAGDCHVTLLPAFGGKIASIKIKGQELLQAPLRTPAPRTHSMSFDAGDASGWDECLPSVAQCEVKGAFGTASIPDHGDLWRVPWQHVESDSNSVTLRGECFSLPLELVRTAQIAETKSGWRLTTDYTLTNLGNDEIPWSWAAHPLFAAAEGDQILLPGSITELCVEGSGGNRLGPQGATVHWPVTLLANGSHADLSIAQAPDSNIGDKVFSRRLTQNENWCALARPSAGLRIKVQFEPEATPYLGLWLCYGGWPDGPGPKQVCVAMEPATAPCDSLAQTGPWSRTLAPGASFSWPMFIDFDLL